LGDEIINSKKYLLRIIDYTTDKTDTMFVENKFNVCLSANSKYRVDIYFYEYGGNTLLIDTDHLKKSTEFIYEARLYPRMIEYVSGYIYVDPKSKKPIMQRIWPLDYRNIKF
jgi:hypothetical protein